MGTATLYQQRKRQGLCVRCGSQSPVPQRGSCARCLEKRAAKAIAKQRQDRAQGCCIRCGAACDDPQFKQCTPCRVKMTAQRQQRQAAGVCTVCGKPAMRFRRSCVAHLQQDAINRHRRQRAQAYESQLWMRWLLVVVVWQAWLDGRRGRLRRLQR